jgi:site-specific recombinase XerD
VESSTLNATTSSPVFKDGVEVLASTLGVARHQIDDAINQFATPTAELLISLAKAALRKGSWWQKAKGRDTGALIKKCFRHIPYPYNEWSLEKQFELIRDVLFVLGRDDVDRYPLVKSKLTKQLDLGAFATSVSLSDGWLNECQTLLVGAYKGTVAISNQDRLGLLCVWLCLGCGVSSKGELTIALNEIKLGRVRNHGELYWTSGCYEKRRGERRRQWLTQDTVLLSQSIDWSDSRCDPSSNFHAIRDALVCLRKHSIALSKLNQSSLFGAGLARGFLLAKLPAFVIEYLRGEISSSSLTESSLARFFDRSPAGLDTVATEAMDNEHLFDDKHFDPPIDTTQKISGLSVCAIDSKAPLTQLSRMLSRSDVHAKADAKSFIQYALQEAVPPLVKQILEWALSRLQLNAPRTVKQGLDHLHARLLPAVPDLEAIDDPDHWAAIVEEITSDLEQRSKALSALSSFATYLSMSFGEEFASAGRTALSGINAQFVTPDELASAITLLQRKLSPERFKIARSIVELAYGAGLRRSEVDGLRVMDIEFGSCPTARVEKNKYRVLKTLNAKRVIPLDITKALFPHSIAELQELAHSAAGHETLLFDQNGHKPLALGETLFNEITQALQEATGEKKVKLHSLRHSFCSLLLLGLFYKQLNLSSFKNELSFLETVEDLLPTILGALLGSGTAGRFELASVRAMMGHLSESTTLLHYFHFLDLMRFGGFSQPDALISLSDQARCGAAGLKQNSRGRGAKQNESSQAIASLLDKFTHKLPPKAVRLTEKVITQFEQSNDLRETLEQVMMLAKGQSLGKDVTDTPIKGWGTATFISTHRGLEWVKNVFLSGAMAREMPKPFDRLEDGGAIDCQQTILGNLSALSASELKRISDELCWLAEQRCTPYITYRFNNFDDLEVALKLLDQLLSGYPIGYTVKAQQKVGRKFVEQDKVESTKIDNLKPVSDARYMLTLSRDGQQFPHRAITWVTIALRICHETTSPTEAGDSHSDQTDR